MSRYRFDFDKSLPQEAKESIRHSIERFLERNGGNPSEKLIEEFCRNRRFTFSFQGDLVKVSILIPPAR